MRMNAKKYGTAALGVAAAVLVASIGLKADTQMAAPAGGGSQMSQADMVKRGEYLVNTSGCHDCHTPWKMGPNGPEPDMTLALSGHPAGMQLPPPPQPVGPWIMAGSAANTAWAGPWGISYTANLTSDKETGVGGMYTEEQFIMTLREGKKQGRGRMILPPMPWPAYGQMTDADLKALYAYLKTTKPIKNKVPEPIINPM